MLCFKLCINQLIITFLNILRDTWFRARKKSEQWILCYISLIPRKKCLTSLTNAASFNFNGYFEFCYELCSDKFGLCYFWIHCTYACQMPLKVLFEKNLMIGGRSPPYCFDAIRKFSYIQPLMTLSIDFDSINLCSNSDLQH